MALLDPGQIFEVGPDFFRNKGTSLHKLNSRLGCFGFFVTGYAVSSCRAIEVVSGTQALHSPLPSARQHQSYGDCLEVKREYHHSSAVLDCVTQCSQSAAHLYDQFLQVKQIGFVTFGPLRCA